MTPTIIVGYKLSQIGLMENYIMTDIYYVLNIYMSESKGSALKNTDNWVQLR